MIYIDVDISDLDRKVNESINELVMEVVRKFALVGEEYIAESRASGSYTDQTGNLRSANSYGVWHDGTLILGSFGNEDTRAFFKGKLEGEGIEFICGNGMEYCSYVEGKGFNVTSSGFLKVMKRINQIAA